MTPIRPNLPAPVQPNGALRPADAARLAAQKAFFEIAAGKAPAPAAALQASAPAVEVRATAPVARTAEIPAEKPARPLRPGSLLDIRV